MPKTTKFPNISDKVQRILDADMDHVANRRRARDAFKDVQLSIDHCLFKMPYEELKIEESYEVNSRGFEIFSKSWIPKTSPLKAVICFCHGYGDTCTFFFEGVARKLASSGYGVFAMDYVGFGLSEGLHGFVPSFEKLVDDVIEQYSKVKGKPEFSALPSFLFGQSMGGAIALKVHLRQPNAWSGAILIAPMCKIANDMLPSKFATRILISVAKVLPKKKIVPQKDLAEMAFRDSRKKDLAAYNVICYNDKPRVGTALELLQTTQQLENQLQEVSLPLLILHGKSDKVTEPMVNQMRTFSAFLKILYLGSMSVAKNNCSLKVIQHLIGEDYTRKRKMWLLHLFEQGCTASIYTFILTLKII